MLLTDYPWYMTLVAVAVGVLYAVALYFWRRPKGSAAVRWGLAAVRCVVVAAMVWLLLMPVAKHTVHERQKPRLLVATDRSLSVGSGCDSSFSFDAITPRLSDRFEVVHFDFGDSSSTDLGAVMQRAADEQVEAVLMATDGIHNRGLSPLTVAQRMAVPVHVVALGDTTPQRDAAVADVHTGRVALRGNTFAVEITISASLLDGRQAQLAVQDAEGTRLWSQRVQYEGSQYAQVFPLQLPAERAGLQAYDVLLEPLPEEATPTNNRVRFYIDVIDTRRRVAIVAHAPHPDVAALRQALSTNPNYEVRVLTAAEAEGGHLRGDSVQLVVLHNLPSAAHPRTDWVGDLPTLFILGLQTDLARFNALRMGLSIDSRTQRPNEVAPIVRSDFSLFSLPEADAAAIEQWPPLSATFGQARMSAGMQTLLGARVGQIDSKQPLVCATAQGDVRRVFVWGEGLWRWRMAEYAANESHDVFDRWVSQMVSFGAMQHREGRWQVSTSRTYLRGEEAMVRAVLYNESYEPTNAPEATFHLSPIDSRGQASPSATYTFRREGRGYALALTGLMPGVYRWRATADGLEDEGSFAVEDMNLELRQRVADHHLLSAVANATGGGLYSPSELAQAVDALSNLKPTIYTHTRYSPLLASGWVLSLLLLLLGIEWAVRKYNGGV